MGLQRTPPTRSQPLPSVSPVPPPAQPTEDVDTPNLPQGNDEADKTTISNISDSKAFAPRHPGVMRTPSPSSGSTEQEDQINRFEHVDERPIRPAPFPPPEEIPPGPMELDVPQIQLEGDKTIVIEDDSQAELKVEQQMVIDTEQSPAKQISMQVDRNQIHSGSAPMEIDIPVQQANSERSTTPTYNPQQFSAQAGPSTIHAPPPTTPSSQSTIPKTPRSRRKTMEPLPSPPRIPSVQQEEEYQFGRRYQLTMETLERAVKAGAQRWTTEHLKGCFPQLTKDLGKPMEDICVSASQSMRQNILASAAEHMKHYKVGPALQAIDAVDKEAKDYRRFNPPESDIGKLGRPDAWRPDVTPNSLTISSVLPIYDNSYSKLREEYLELHKYCSDKYKTLIEKQNQLNELENGVSDGVIELEKTIEILDNLPMEDMMIWTESAESKLDTRAPEQIQ
ncbi:hypothetical protein V865_001340 [Kwoniella europaea PYCC6329]|uniref:Uncharacterized protein n=1 Tax=Kwoniella europaea PYCC6329 TaxID=1423913 RepID=A0AAX4KBE3_9TREE